MLLCAVCILSCLLMVFYVRKHKKILATLIAIETLVLILLLAVTYLSAAGCNDVYLLIAAKAITGEVTLFGMTISSLVLIQAVVVLLACFIALYGIYRVVKRVVQSKRSVYARKNIIKVLSSITRCFTQRKVFKLYCRMNN